MELSEAIGKLACKPSGKNAESAIKIISDNINTAENSKIIEIIRLIQEKCENCKEGRLLKFQENIKFLSQKIELEDKYQRRIARVIMQGYEPNTLFDERLS